MICDCASGEALEILIEELESLERKDGESPEYTAKPQREALRLLFDALGWLEHGIAARGGWITPSGSAALDKARALLAE